MDILIKLIVDNAGEIGTFVATSIAAYLKRRYDLKKIAKDEKTKQDFINNL